MRHLLLVASLLAVSVSAYASFEWWSRLFGPTPRPVGPGPAAGVAPPRSAPDVPMDLHLLVDQFGYLPGDAKVGVVRDPHEGFDRARRFEPGSRYEVRTAPDGLTVATVAPRPWQGGAVQESSGDAGWWVDFSNVHAPGRYYLFDAEKGVRSATFGIGQDVYRDLLRSALRIYYYQRSAFDKRPPFAEDCWVDAPAYVGPGQDREARDVARQQDAASARDVSGGWFDAGDTNMYVTFVAGPVNQLLTAYKDFPKAFGDDLDIPESGNGVPDIVDEVRYEIAWLKKMQNADGTSLLKVGAIKHVVASPPSSDRTPRFYIGPCTSSTIAAAGMFAHAAEVFARFPATRADVDDLVRRARAGFEAYLRAPAIQTDCDDQTVVAGDADRTAEEQHDLAVIAAVYLFSVTGERRYHDYVKANYAKSYPYRDIGWTRYNPQVGEALLWFARLPGTDAALGKTIRDDKTRDAQSGNGVYGASPDDLYRNLLHREQYHWGSNSIRANYANSNLDMIVHGLNPAQHAAYRARALESLHYLHGVNPLGIAYISNTYRHGASYSVNEMFHQWYAPRTRWANALTSPCGPVPGYMVSGPNAAAVQDGVPRDMIPPAGQPPQKSYRDWNEGWPEASYALTEASTGSQSGYVKLLAAFVEPR